MKIVICSDNHTNRQCLQYILQNESNADYYWHLGDSEYTNIKELSPFVSIMGNNDFFLDLPATKEFELCGHKFLLTHGHRQLMYGPEQLAAYTKDKGCDIVLFGHTHMPCDKVINGVRMVNPGSCNHNRGGFDPSYCVMHLDKNGKIDFQFKSIDNKKEDKL